MGAGYIDRPTADRLTAAADAADQADVQLRTAVMEAVAAGISLRAISRAVRIPHQRVGRIAERARDEVAAHGRLLTTEDTYRDPYGGEPRDPLDRRRPWRGVEGPDIREDPTDQGHGFA